MPREWHALNPERRRNGELPPMPLQPELERGVQLHTVLRKLGALAAGAAVLGMTWVICEAFLMLVRLSR